MSLTDTATAALDAVRVEDAISNRVVSCPPDATVAVARRMVDERIHCVVVAGIVKAAGGERLSWGVLTDRDLLDAPAEGDWIDSRRFRPPRRDRGADTMRQAAEQMRRLGTSHLVMAHRRTGDAVGVVSSLDVAGGVTGGRRPSDGCHA